MLDPTTNKMMVYDTEKYLLQPHIPGIVLSLYNTPHYKHMCYNVGVSDSTGSEVDISSIIHHHLVW